MRWNLPRQKDRQQERNGQSLSPHSRQGLPGGKIKTGEEGRPGCRCEQPLKFWYGWWDGHCWIPHALTSFQELGHLPSPQGQWNESHIGEGKAEERLMVVGSGGKTRKPSLTCWFGLSNGYEYRSTSRDGSSLWVCSVSTWDSWNMAPLNAAPVRENSARGSRYLPESQAQRKAKSDLDLGS